MNDKKKSTGLTVDNSGMKPESPTVTVASPAPASSQGLMMGVSYAKYSSPIPPAEEMKRYAEVHHELPQKILEMTCAEQAHRHQQDLADNAYREQLVKSNFRLTCCGVIASVVVVMLIMAAIVASRFCAARRRFSGVYDAFAAAAFLMFSRACVRDTKTRLFYTYISLLSY